MAMLLLGCPAEMLGIPVPRGGVEAVSMEDLRRDVDALSSRKDEARRAFLAERWAQMGLAPDADGRCGRRSGSGSRAVAVVADEGTDGAPESWSEAAVAITLAKTLHGRPEDPLGVVFCVGSAPDAARVLRLDVDAGSGPDPDWRRLEAAARSAHETLIPWLSSPSAGP